MPHGILFAASEAYPLIKTGGLADYAGGLTKALVRHGHDVQLVLPCYPATIEHVAGPVASTRATPSVPVRPR